QSSCANTNAAKSTSWDSSTRRSSVERPGLKAVVQGSTSAMSSRPSVIAARSSACLPEEPRKMRGLFMRGSPCPSWGEVLHNGVTCRPEKRLELLACADRHRDETLPLVDLDRPCESLLRLLLVPEGTLHLGEVAIGVAQQLERVGCSRPVDR